MDSEKPSSLRGLLTRMVCILFGVVLLYALSEGPAMYIVERFPNSQPLIYYIYFPLGWAKTATSLPWPLQVYDEWWLELALRQEEGRRYQTPPATP